MVACSLARRRNTLRDLTPYECIDVIWTPEPDRFIVDPIHPLEGLGINGGIQMPGVIRLHRVRGHGRAFPHSRYDDPRGGRASALERNVLRYRAIEVSLYLFYAAEIREFILENVFPMVPAAGGTGVWETAAEARQKQLIRAILAEAEAAGRIGADDAVVLNPAKSHDAKEGKKLRRAFGHAVAHGMFDAAEADELMTLLQYRNEIAHHIQLVMADVTRSYWTADHVACSAPTYRSGALDRLRTYRRDLWERFGRLSSLYRSSFDGLLFEHAEKVFETDLVRLDRRIRAQIQSDRERLETLRSELSLRGTGLVGDLHPRAPWNFRSAGHGSQQTGRLTPQGVEICYRLLDFGKSPLAIAYLMGISLRACQNRARRWREAGGPDRVRNELKRHPGTGGRAAPG